MPAFDNALLQDGLFMRLGDALLGGNDFAASARRAVANSRRIIHGVVGVGIAR